MCDAPNFESQNDWLSTKGQTVLDTQIKDLGTNNGYFGEGIVLPSSSDTYRVLPLETSLVQT